MACFAVMIFSYYSSQALGQGGASNHINFDKFEGFVNNVRGHQFQQAGDLLQAKSSIHITNGTASSFSVMVVISVDGQTQTTIGPAIFPPNSSMDLRCSGSTTTTTASQSHNITASVTVTNLGGNMIMGEGTCVHWFNKRIDPVEEEEDEEEEGP
jgi:hypothetical protein